MLLLWALEKDPSACLPVRSHLSLRNSLNMAGTSFPSEGLDRIGNPWRLFLPLPLQTSLKAPPLEITVPSDTFNTRKAILALTQLFPSLPPLRLLPGLGLDCCPGLSRHQLPPGPRWAPRAYLTEDWSCAKDQAQAPPPRVWRLDLGYFLTNAVL